MKFWKYHVNGNDFILIHHPCHFTNKQIRKYCDRHMGIGADGILFVYHKKGKLMYEHYNEDGSKANMCGNGIRCVALDEMKRKQTDHCDVMIANQTYHLTMSAGNFVTLICELPTRVGKNRYRCGVEHLITKRYQARDDANVDVVEYHDAMHFSLRTIELGVGPTLSCGTGTIVAYYHGYRHHQLSRIAIASSPGGKNLLRYGNHKIYLSAVVQLVYQGNITMDEK